MYFGLLQLQARQLASPEQQYCHFPGFADSEDCKIASQLVYCAPSCVVLERREQDKFVLRAVIKKKEPISLIIF